MIEITALRKGWKFFIEKTKFGYALYLRCSDFCGNSYSGQFDFHWTYDTREEAMKDGYRLST